MAKGKRKPAENVAEDAASIRKIARIQVDEDGDAENWEDAVKRIIKALPDTGTFDVSPADVLADDNLRVMVDPETGLLGVFGFPRLGIGRTKSGYVRAFSTGQGLDLKALGWKDCKLVCHAFCKGRKVAVAADLEAEDDDSDDD